LRHWMTALMPPIVLNISLTLYKKKNHVTT